MMKLVCILSILFLHEVQPDLDVGPAVGVGLSRHSEGEMFGIAADFGGPSAGTQSDVPFHLERVRVMLECFPLVESTVRSTLATVAFQELITVVYIRS